MYVTCQRRLTIIEDTRRKKIKMYRILWMTVNSNWSLMDNGVFKWNVFNKGSWHLEIIRIWFIYQNPRSKILVIYKGLIKSTQYNQYLCTGCNLNNTNWLPYLVLSRKIYFSVDISLACSVCFTWIMNVFNNWCPRVLPVSLSYYFSW